MKSLYSSLALCVKQVHFMSPCLQGVGSMYRAAKEVSLNVDHVD
jgi:hypothetical protein